MRSVIASEGSDMTGLGSFHNSTRKRSLSKHLRTIILTQ